MASSGHSHTLDSLPSCLSYKLITTNTKLFPLLFSIDRLDVNRRADFGRFFNGQIQLAFLSLDLNPFCRSFPVEQSRHTLLFPSPRRKS